MEDIDFKTVSKLLRYDPATGVIYWLVTRGNRTPAGSVAGTKGKGGYIAIGIGRRYFKAHRIAWLLAKGEWPEGLIDHVNGDKADNRLSNLRLATQAENSRNQGLSANNSSGFKGVHWHKRRQAWAASIRVNWKLYHLGYFDTPEQAALSYDSASRRLHGEFGRPSLLTPAGRIPVDA